MLVTEYAISEDCALLTLKFALSAFKVTEFTDAPFVRSKLVPAPLVKMSCWMFVNAFGVTPVVIKFAWSVFIPLTLPIKESPS